MEYIEKMLGSLIESCTPIALKLVAAVIILIVGLKLIKWGAKKLAKSKVISKIDSSLASFLTSFLKIALYVVLVLTIASILGIPMASFVTILASAGVAIGLALQGSLSNLAGGVMILLFRPYRVGDYVKTASGEGIVKDITVFYTILTTDDNKTITLPNGGITNSAITNFSTADLRRVDLAFTAPRATNTEMVKSTLLDVANRHPQALKDPAPFARISALPAGNLEFSLRIWCKNEDYWTVYHDVIETVKDEFEKKGI